MTQVFISYSRRDLPFVGRLTKDLKAAGLETWYDLSGLEAGKRWGQEIQKAIRQSQYIIVVLSPNSTESEWVEREFLYACNQKLKVIPLLYQPCDLPMWSLNLHFIDMHGQNYKRNFKELLRVLGIEQGREVTERRSVEDSLQEIPITDQPTQSAVLVEEEADQSVSPAAPVPDLEDVIPTEKPRRPSKKWNKITLSLIGAAALITTLFFLLPWLFDRLPANQRAASEPTHNPASILPTSLATFTATAPPTSIPTTTPTSPPTASPTVAATAFYEPIQAYINSQSPTLEDDFSNTDSTWPQNSEGSHNYGNIMDGVLYVHDFFEPNTGSDMFSPDYYVPGVTFPTTGALDGSDFALQFQFQIRDAKSIGIQFRSTESLSKGYRLTITSTGKWDLQSHPDETVLADGSMSMNSTGDLIEVLIIVYSDHASLFLNDRLIYNGNDFSTSYRANRILVIGNTSGGGPTFDNFKFWNLVDVDF